MSVSSSPVEDPTPSGQGGRVRQRRRTRKAILAAAGELMAAGETPSVAEIAEAADVSKRTVYLYFPTHEQLLLDAALGMLASGDPESALRAEGSPEDRVAALVRHMTDIAPDVELAGRALIRLTVESERPTVEGDPRADGSPVPRRGYRRIEWLERALDPLRERLGEPRFERLVTALAMIAGFEAVIVHRDLRGLTPEQGADASEWAARALIRATLEEADQIRSSQP